MHSQAIPHQQDFTRYLPLEMPKEVGQLRGFDGTRIEPEVEAAPSHARRRRKLLPPAGMAQDGSLSARSPGAHHLRTLAQPAFVEEDDDAPVPAGFFLMEGQRYCFQFRMACSSRSKARRAGFWQLQPIWRNKRLTCAMEYRCPKRLPISATTRGKVQRAVRWPRVFSGPLCKSAASWTRSSGWRRGLRPARPGCLSALFPPASHAACQRPADWLLTPKRRATSAWSAHARRV